MVSKIHLEERAKRRESSQDLEATRTKRHETGKLTARERIDLLTDPGTFDEMDSYRESHAPKFGKLKEKATTRQAVITGAATIEKRRVYLYSQDFTVEGVYAVAASGRIEKIIDPKETHPALIRALHNHSGKDDSLPWKKHGLTPL
jgi:propionyl-CoA carboxylase beta chain